MAIELYDWITNLLEHSGEKKQNSFENNQLVGSAAYETI